MRGGSEAELIGARELDNRSNMGLVVDKLANAVEQRSKRIQDTGTLLSTRYALLDFLQSANDGAVIRIRVEAETDQSVAAAIMETSKFLKIFFGARGFRELLGEPCREFVQGGLDLFFITINNAAL